MKALDALRTAAHEQERIAAPVLAQAQRHADSTGRSVAVYLNARGAYLVETAADVLPGSVRVAHVSPKHHTCPHCGRRG